MNSKLRRLTVPAVSTMAMLVILLGLGTWQVERLAWKRGILAQIAQAETQPAIPLPVDPPPFAKVSATGRLRTDLAALYGAEVRDTARGSVLGAQLLVPMERAGQPPLLVDLGWVPTDPSPIAATQLSSRAGPVTVEGYVRAADRAGMFAAVDDPAKRLFYTLDPAAIGAALGLKQIAPFTLVALGSKPAQGAPEPAEHLPRPPNDHLSYAITWYGLAATLVVIFGLYARKVMRT